MARKLYRASDYAGLATKTGLHFYYGCEHTRCKHGDDIEDGCDSEWCFVVYRKNKEVWRCGTKTLERTFPRTFDGSEPCEAYLLAGIGLYQETFHA